MKKQSVPFSDQYATYHNMETFVLKYSKNSIVVEKEFIMKKIIAIVATLFCVITLSAQDSLTVKSFELDPTDLTAQQRNIKDGNGDICALVKVQMVDNEVKFEGDIIGQSEQQKNEYYVFLINGTQRLKVMSQKALPLEIEFSDYGIEELKGGSTYVLKIIWSEKAPGVSFHIGIPNVAITVEGKTYTTDEMGDLDLPLVNGKYSYVVEKENYVTIYDTLIIDRLPVIKNITLQTDSRLKDKGLLIVTYPLNAEFTIEATSDASSKPAKKKVLTGEALALNGDYQVSFKKKKYVSETISVTVKQGQVVNTGLNPTLEADLYFKSGNYKKAFKEYNKLAKSNDDLALLRLGSCYMDGKGVPANRKQAISCWRKAAARGNMQAYQYLCDSEHSMPGKLVWLAQAASKGDKNSIMQLVKHYKEHKEWKEVKRWLDEVFALDAPSADAYYEMGELYYRGDRGLVQNFSRAYKYFANAASQGHTVAKERIIDYTYLGLDGHKTDPKKAISDYLQLEQLSDDGNYKVGMYYYDIQNIDYAHFYLSKLSVDNISEVPYTGNARAVFEQLGNSFFGKKDYGAAVFYYRLHEKIGGSNINVFNKLGDAYRLGQGITKNVSLAYSCYKKSSEQGDKEGYCMLGLCYEKGYGVVKNLNEAVRLYTIADEKGSPRAAAYLGTMYYQGLGGLAKDREKAIMLWTKAGNANVKAAINNLINYYKFKRNQSMVSYWTNKKNSLSNE